MDTNTYLTFLLLGALLVVIDGQIIYRNGRRLLRQAGADTGSAEPITRLIVVLFHLVALGVLAIGSTIDTESWGSVTGVVGRLGILLLFLAIVHGVATAVLSNFRDREVNRARRVARRTVGAGRTTGRPGARAARRRPLRHAVAGGSRALYSHLLVTQGVFGGWLMWYPSAEYARATSEGVFHEQRDATDRTR